MTDTITALQTLKQALNDAELELNLNGDTCNDFFSDILTDLGIDYNDLCDT